MGRAEVCICKGGKLKRLYQRDENSLLIRTDWRQCDACGAMMMDPKKARP